MQAFHQVLLIILHASVHQTLLENDTIDYAEETLEALQRKDRQQSTHPTDAAVSANNKYLTVKKKKIPSNLATTHHQHPQQMMESSISSSATPSLAMLSLTGVLPVDEILPNDEKPHKVKMRSIEEEHGHPSPHPASHRSPRIVDLPECNPLTEPVTDPGGVPGEEDKIGVALFSNDYDTS